MPLITTFAARGLDAQDANAKKSPASASKTKSAPKSGASKQTKATPKPATQAAAKPAAHHKTTTKSSKKPVAVSRRWAQQQPTTERYKEIQQALSERGYFSGSPDGTWGPESIDSLKRFQRDQSLTEDGKIGSLSLIALGLGPKRPVPEPAPEKTQNE